MEKKQKFIYVGLGFIKGVTTRIVTSTDGMVVAELQSASGGMAGLGLTISVMTWEVGLTVIPLTGLTMTETMSQVIAGGRHIKSNWQTDAPLRGRREIQAA